MKQRGSPFWLFCDVLCWIGVSLTFQLFARTLGEIAEVFLAERRRSIKLSEFNLASRLLLQAEAWMRFAIARRAFRLAGIKARVRFPTSGQVTDVQTLLNRSRQLTAMFDNLDAYARTMARRLRTTATPQHRNRATPQALAASAAASPTPKAHSPRPARATATPQHRNNRIRAGIRVRAPPWRLSMPIADCLLPRKRQLPRTSAFGHSVHPEQRRKARVEGPLTPSRWALRSPAHARPARS